MHTSMNSPNVALGRTPIWFCPATHPKARKLHVRSTADDQGGSKIGSYAAKLEQARREGRGTDPSQVNPLHPQSATWLRQDQDRAAEQEDNGWEDDGFNFKWDETSSPLDDFSGSDLDDDEDEKEEPDPYGFRANVQAMVENPGRSSMQVRDLPTPEDAFVSVKQREEPPAFDTQGSGVARQEFGFNNQSGGSRAEPASRVGEVRPKRGLGDVVESRKSRPGRFVALKQSGQQAIDHGPQAGGGRKGGAAERPELPPNNAWLEKTAGEALSEEAWYDAEAWRGGAPGEWETGDDWSGQVSAPEGRNTRKPSQGSSRPWREFQGDRRRGPARSSRSFSGQQSQGSQRTGFRQDRDYDFAADRRGEAAGSSSKWSDGSHSGSDWFDGSSYTDDANKSGHGRESKQERGGEEDPWQSRWLEDADASGRSVNDAKQMARDMKPRKQKRHASKDAGSTQEAPDFANLLKLAAKPAEERAQRQSGAVKGPAADFYQAADVLMTRLTIGVEGERQEAVDAQQRVYSRRTIEQLRTAGVVVTHLRGTSTGQIFTEFLWEFTVAPDADLKGAIYEEEEATKLEGDKRGQATSASEVESDNRAAEQGTSSASKATAEGGTHAANEEERGPKRRLMPMHVFRKGDPVLLIQAREDGSLPNFKKHPDLKEMHPALQAQVRATGRTFIKVSVMRDVHELLLQSGSEQQWRMDKTVQETTVNRQLQKRQSRTTLNPFYHEAIAMLDKPFAYLEQQNALQADRQPKDPDSRAEIASGLEALLEEHYEQRKRGFYSKEFREGELRIRHILLGVSGQKAAALTGAEPGSRSAAAALAAKVPYWAMVDGYQQEAKRLLAEHFVKDLANKLNRSQIHAISHSLSATLSLWQGPPGTGKTRTLLGLLVTMSKLGHWLEETHSIKLGPVLACADTNAATDNILEGLFQRGVDVVRLGRPSNVRDELHDATLEHKAQLHPIGKEALKKREQADEVFAQRREEAAQFDSAAANVVEDDRFKRRQLKLMNKARALEADSRNLMLFAQRDVLRKAEVVTGTCSGAGDTDILTTMRFTVVVLDEATQSTEPSTLIPLLRGAESVVMAGDPNQLPPTVLSHTGRAASLDTTLFDRLQGSEVRPMLLDTQYRMHPSIAGFPSQMFYDGKLRSGIKPSDRPAPKGFPWPNPDCPVAMVECDHGSEQRGVLKAGQLTEADSLAPGASSYFNIDEARLAVRAFEMLMTAQDAASGAILSPYNGQVKLIRNLIKQTSIKDKVVVSSVDGYQGREADVIVFSSVRCNIDGLLGFLSDERRLNVAITRPRRGLVVVGSPDTLSSDERWRLWLAWVRDHGGFLSQQALRLTDEERAAGFFDPQVAPDSPQEEAEESDLTWEAPSGVDPDNADERVLASMEVGKADIADDWYN